MSIALAALDYARRGHRVLPVEPGGKVPHALVGKDWPKKATADVATVIQWWRTNPDANVGIVCDRAFGFVLDCDDLEALDFMPELPHTLTARTPSGGRHYVFLHPDGETLDNTSRGIMAWLKSRGYEPSGSGKVDIRGSRGQIVVAPSVRAGGLRYEWVDASAPIAPAPRWLLEAIHYTPPVRSITGGTIAEPQRDLGPYIRAAVDGEARELASAAEGMRGTKAYASGAALGSLGLSLGETERELLPACENNGLVGKDGINRVRREIARGWEKGAAEPRQPPEDRPGWRRPEDGPPAYIVQGGPIDPPIPPPTDDDAPMRRRANANDPPWASVYPPDHQRAGQPTTCLANTRIMLDHHGAVCRVNLMSHKDEITIGRSGAVTERASTVGIATIRELAREYGLNSGQALIDHLSIIMVERAVHPVADWIRSRPWDGVDRTEALLESLTMAPDSNRALALRMLRTWLATAARAALVPSDAQHGIAAQGILVLQGRQGTRKSSWVMSLVPPNSGWAKESVLLDPSDRDSVQRATEFWLVELGELDATFRKADIAALKAHITASTDTYRRAYAAASETVPRRTIYAATVNDQTFLVDETGSRRFWVLAVLACNPDHGIDLQQLWAQAATLEVEGLYLKDDEQRASEDSNQAHEVIDPIWESLARVIEPSDSGWMHLDEIAAAIDRDRSWSASDKRHLGRVLRNRMGASTRKLKGYTLFRVVRVAPDPGGGP